MRKLAVLLLVAIVIAIVGLRKLSRPAREYKTVTGMPIAWHTNHGWSWETWSVPAQPVQDWIPRIRSFKAPAYGRHEWTLLEDNGGQLWITPGWLSRHERTVRAYRYKTVSGGQVAW